jgi:hypothetical protein
MKSCARGWEGAAGRGDNGDADVILLVAVLAPVPTCDSHFLAETVSKNSSRLNKFTSPLAFQIFCDTHTADPFCQMAKGFEQVLKSITQKPKARN